MRVYRIRDKIGFVSAQGATCIGRFELREPPVYWMFVYYPWATRDRVATSWVAERVNKMNEVRR